MFLCVEACNEAIYIRIRCPHRILEDKTPEGAFISVNPEASHFHIFGCPIYIHIPIEKRTKLEPSNRKVLFVSYSETSKAYKIYILGEKRQLQVGI